MALSGTIYSSSVGGLGAGTPYRVKFIWSGSQSISGNYTDISWSVRGDGGNSGWWVQNYNAITKINGSTVQNKGSFQMYQGSVFGSGTARVYHNSDGTKTVNFNLSNRIYWNTVNSTANVNVALNTIPRGATFTATEGAGSWSESDPLSYTISNPANGYIRVFGRETTSTSSPLWFDIDYGKTSGAKNFTPSQSQYDDLFQAHPNEASFSHRVEMRTYSSPGFVNQLGNSVYFNVVFNMTGANPTFADFDYKDSNTTTSAITGDDSVFIQDHSNLEVTIPVADKATPLKFATMNRYEATFDGSTVNGTFSDVADVVIDHGTVNASTNGTLGVKAVDSRSLGTTVNKTLTVIPYAPPVVNASATRANGFENDITLVVDGTFSRLTVGGVDKNTIGASAVEYRTKVQDGTWSSWSTISRTLGTGTFDCSDVALSFDNTKYVDFEVRATDALETTTTSFRVDAGKPTFYIDAKRNSVGVGKISEENDALDVDGDIYTKGKKVVSLGDVLLFAYNPSSMSVATKTWEMFKWQDTDVDTHSKYNSTTGEYEIPENGIYSISAFIRLESTSGSYRYVLVARITLGTNGNSTHTFTKYISDDVGGGNTGDTSSNHGTGGQIEMYLSEGDKVGIDFYHNVASTRTYPQNGTSKGNNYFQIRKVSDWTP